MDYQEEQYQRIRKKIKRKKEFYSQVFSWAIFSAILLFVNLRTSPYHFWFIYPFLGWGLSIVFQAKEIYFDEDEEELILREMDKREWNRRKPYRPDQELAEEEALVLRDVPKVWNNKDFV